MKKMRKIITIILFASYILTNAQNTNHEWALSLDERITVSSTTLDSSGNLYSTGWFRGTIDFDHGVGVTNLTSINNTTDVFIQKNDPSGNLLWAKRVGGNAFEYGNSIVTDVLGNAYITGKFGLSVDFDPGTSNAILSSNGADDFFVLKLDSNGNFVWAKSAGGASSDFGSSITLGKQGDIYISGEFSGTADLDPGIGITNLTSQGGSDIFIQKLNLNGNFIWAKSIGGNAIETFKSMSTDYIGNLYLTGEFEDTVDFDPSIQTVNLTTAFNGSGFDRDVYILKLDSTGNFLWVKQIKGGFQRSESIKYYNGSVYIAGAFTNTVDFDPGAGVVNLTGQASNDIYILNLTPNGNFNWVKEIKGNAHAIPNSIITDSNGDLYLTGYFAGSYNFHTGSGITYVTAAGNHDIFNLKLDSLGNLIWVIHMGDTQNDEGNDINVDRNSNIFIAGEFRGMVDFDPSAGQDVHFAINGNKKHYFQKLNQGTVGLVKNSFEEKIEAYPNPTERELFIQFNQIHHLINVRFTDITGRLISEQQFGNTNLLQLSIDGKNGLYFIEIENNLGNKAVFRIIKKS